MEISFLKWLIEIGNKNNIILALATSLEIDLITNLRILNTIQLDKGGVEQGNPELAKVAMSLKSENILASLIEGKRRKNFWEEKMKFLDEGMEGGKDGIENPKEEEKSFRQVLLAVYISILTLQAISNFDHPIWGNLRLKTRLKNLRDNHFKLVKFLNKQQT